MVVQTVYLFQMEDMLDLFGFTVTAFKLFHL